MDKLLIYNGTHFLNEHTLSDITSIGRLRKNTIQLESSEISRVHAIITRTESGFVIVDRGSMNGTFVNDRKLVASEPAPLGDGDRIRLETFELRVSLSSEAARFDAQQVSESSLRLARVLEEPPERSLPLSNALGDSIWSSGSTRVVVADILEETRDARTFRLVGKKTRLFSYEPGQFVTLSLDIDFETGLRSFSLSSSPSRPHAVDVTVKRSSEGGASAWLHDNLKLGDEVTMRGPSGTFSCSKYPSRKLLFIAGGIGITPLMSMCRWIVDTAADVDVVLLYSVRAPGDIVFRAELDFLAARHRNLRVVTTVTSNWDGTQPWSGRTGRVDRAMIEDVVDDLSDRHVYLSCPNAMRESVMRALRSAAFPLKNLHTESFRSDRVAAGTVLEPPSEPASLFPAPAERLTDDSEVADASPERDAATPPSPATPGLRHRIRFARSKVEAHAAGDVSLLEVAEANGVEIPYGCRSGVCGTCLTACVEGEVERIPDASATDGATSARASEGPNGNEPIYVCVARPTSDVVLDA